MYWIGILGQIGIYAILAMSLNLICGLTGILQLGQAAFFAVGAYTAGLVALYFTFPALGWFNFLLSAVAAMAVAALFSLVIGLPCLRLRGDYLAVATLAFGEVLRLILINVDFPGCALTGGESFGGATGIAFPERPEYSAAYAHVWVIWLGVGLSYWFFLNVKDSAIGRAFLCIREDEIAATAMGIDLARYKLAAFTLSAVFAGLAGALFFHKELRVAPNDFNFLRSIELLLMVVLGGLGSFTGALCAAVVLGALPELLRFGGLSEYRPLLYPLLLIILIRLRPDGLLGLHEWPWRYGTKEARGT